MKKMKSVSMIIFVNIAIFYYHYDDDDFIANIIIITIYLNCLTIDQILK